MNLCDWKRKSLLRKRITISMMAHAMNEQQLAKILGVAEADVHAWIEGTMKPQYKHVQRMADIFQTTTEWLLEGAHPFLAHCGEQQDKGKQQ